MIQASELTDGERRRMGLRQAFLRGFVSGRRASYARRLLVMSEMIVDGRQGCAASELADLVMQLVAAESERREVKGGRGR